VSEPAGFRGLAPRVVAALNARDVEEFLTLVSPDVEFVPLVAGVEGGVYRGHEGVRRWLEDTWSTMEGYEASIEVLDEIAGRVGVFRIELKLRGRGSGVEVETSAYQAAELDREGRLCRWRFFDRLDDAQDVAREWASAAPPRS
jgi:hypothetical protein